MQMVGNLTPPQPFSSEITETLCGIYLTVIDMQCMCVCLVYLSKLRFSDASLQCAESALNVKAFRCGCNMIVAARLDQLLRRS